MNSPLERREPPAPRAALWFAFLGGPIAWSAHLLASYPMVSVACRMGTAAPLHAITAITAALAAASALAGLLAYRRVRDGGQGGVGGGVGDRYARARFMAIAGMVIGGFFTFVILVEGLPPALQDPCQRTF
jgi:hypothetical protein